MKKQNDFVEEKLQVLKEEYQKPQMSQSQLKELRKRMKEANMADIRSKSVKYGFFSVLLLERLNI